MGRNGGKYVKMGKNGGNLEKFGGIGFFPHFPPFSPIVPHFSSPCGACWPPPHPNLSDKSGFLGVFTPCFPHFPTQITKNLTLTPIFPHFPPCFPFFPRELSLMPPPPLTAFQPHRHFLSVYFFSQLLSEHFLSVYFFSVPFLCHGKPRWG